MKRRISLTIILAVQVVFVFAFALAFSALSEEGETQFRAAILEQEFDPEVSIPRKAPLSISPLYDDETVVSHEDLAAVLKKIRPKFPIKRRKPNYVEHALRAWGTEATFTDPAVMSGAEMRDFLLDHSRYAVSWSKEDSQEVDPLLIDMPHGVDIRWGSHDETSVHHDHLLACLSEAGVPLDQKVYAPSARDLTLNDVLQQSLRDFRPDERETEWSALTYALWLPPVNTWKTKTGRTVTFDMLAERLMRGQKQLGVCSGTHRVYSLMLLWRLNQTHEILSEESSKKVYAHLENVRDLITVSQFPDGHWPPNWPDGKAAVEKPTPDEAYRDVIATGHQLEWLAIAPIELHPPREMVRKAARWLVENTTSKTDEYIQSKYTFYSHVGNALALWRKTHPAEFWQEWTQKHPDYEMAQTPAPQPEPKPAPKEESPAPENPKAILVPKPA